MKECRFEFKDEDGTVYGCPDPPAFDGLCHDHLSSDHESMWKAIEALRCERARWMDHALEATSGDARYRSWEEEEKDLHGGPVLL